MVDTSKVSKLINAVNAWHENRGNILRIADYLGEDYQSIFEFMLNNGLCDINGDPEEGVVPQDTINCLVLYLAVRKTEPLKVTIPRSKAVKNAIFPNLFNYIENLIPMIKITLKLLLN